MAKRILNWALRRVLGIDMDELREMLDDLLACAEKHWAPSGLQESKRKELQNLIDRLS